MLKELYHLISGRRRSMLLSMFLPTFLFGDIFDADAASQRTYQRIAEIRRQNAARNAAKAAAARTADTAAKAAAPKLRYTWIKSQRYILLGDIAKFYGLSLVTRKRAPFCTARQRWTSIIINALRQLTASRFISQRLRCFAEAMLI